MGLLDSLPFFSSFYGSDKSLRVRRSWSRISHTQSDIVPLNSQTSPTEGAPVVPQPLDLELANRLLSRGSGHLYRKVTSREYALNDLANESAPVNEENAVLGRSELNKYVTAPIKATAATEAVCDDLNTTSTAPSGESKRSGIPRMGSRGLGGFKKLLNHRKSQPKQPTSEPLKAVQPSVTSGGDDGDEEGSSNFTDAQHESGEPQTGDKDVPQNPPSGTKPDQPPDPRKVSDQTVLSLESDKTTLTVCRRPSKHASSPIATVDRNYIYKNPFEDVREASHSRAESNPFVDQPESSSRSARQSSSEYSDSGSQVISYKEAISERPNKPVIYHRPTKKTNGSRESLCQRLFTDSSMQSRQFDQRRAALEFNHLAAKLNLRPLALSANSRPITTETLTVAETKLPRRKDTILRKIRTMRSSLSIKPPKNTGGKTLRRIKTLANLSSRYHQMDSLKGKSLETLARLGGHSFLTLPADFAPTTLKLPVCIVATASYLSCYAPKARNVFFDSGDMKAAVRMYDHYASQVLSAEREKDKIDMTMRASNLPSDSVGSDRDYLFNGRFHVHSVACVFKQFLSGLPGGILGSVELFRVLVDIYEHRFYDSEVDTSECRLAGFSSAASTRIKVIALAILALTSEMQLELICAVFGLSALLLHETERNIELQKQAQRINSGSSCLSGFLDLDRLGRVFGPLLTGSSESVNNDTFADIEREIQGERVTMMLIENWRGVSRQLKVWEVFGFPTGAGGVPATVCEENALVEGDS